MIKAILVSIGVVAFLLFVIVYFSPIPTGTCPTISSLLSKDIIKLYERHDGSDCGMMEARYYTDAEADALITSIVMCINDAAEACEPAKALSVVQGFERRFYYLIETTQDCEVRIIEGGCGEKEVVCEALVSPVSKKEFTPSEYQCAFRTNYY